MSETAELRVDDVVDVSGPVEEGRTLELLLEDDRVLVARVRQVQTGEIECPVDGCFRRFDSERGKKTHIGKFHPQWEGRLKECPTCEETFEPTRGRSTQIYCSQECYLNDPSGTETLVCEQCGKTFDVKASHADERKHCSRACKAEAMRGPRESNTREARTCPECDEDFETYPSVDQTYCSRDCASASRWEERQCPMCERPFEVRKQRDKTYCSQPCHYEFRRDDGRPDDYWDLFAELHDERDDLDDVVERAVPHVAPEFDALDARLFALLVDSETPDYETAVTRAFVQLDGGHSKDELTDRLLAIFCADPAYPDHIEPADLGAVFGMDVILEVTDRLRVERTLANEMLERLGILDQYQTGQSLVQAMADGGESA